MTVRPLPTLVLVLCAASALARPDCNACFMKNAAKDLAHQPSPSAPTPGTATEPTPPTGPARGSASPSKGGEAAAAARPDPLVRAKRTAHAAAASWDHVDRDADHNVQIQNRLRDALLAESANTAPGQWWDDAPVDVVDELASASAKWPYRGRWREFRVGQNLNQNQAGAGGGWGDVTDAMTQRAGQGFV